MRHAIAATLVILGTLVLSDRVAAETVTLSSPDGGISVSGRFLSYDGEFYRIDSVYGVLTVDGAGVVCEGAPCPVPGRFVAELTISGPSGETSGLLPGLLEAFADRRGVSWVRQEEDDDQFLYILSDADTKDPIARFRFRATSPAEGFADLLAEAADVVVATRSPTKEERLRALEAGQGDLSTDPLSRVLALDALVPVVSEDNPVQSIRYRDLALVLSGRTRNWKSLGGPDAGISVHLPAMGSSLDQALSGWLTKGGAVEEGRVVRHESSQSLDESVSRDPAAIGVTAFSGIEGARPLMLEGSCGARISADRMTVKTEDYPLTAPYFLFSPDRRHPEILRDFLAFVRSPLAQDVVRAAGFVDQTFEYRRLSDQGDRLIRSVLATGPDVGSGDIRRLFATLANAEQMSLTFRFTNGSAEMDPQSRANVALLADAIGRGEFSGRRLILAGFSDAQGDAETNRDLSSRRAEAVRDALVGMLPDSGVDAVLEAEGYGEAMPLACDEDDWGRKMNRRVEVWLARR